MSGAGLRSRLTRGPQLCSRKREAGKAPPIMFPSLSISTCDGWAVFTSGVTVVDRPSQDSPKRPNGTCCFLQNLPNDLKGQPALGWPRVFEAATLRQVVPHSGAVR